jgi:lipopolysaccharide biosynthesis glycosyltransferase
MNHAIVSLADDKYFHLLNELIDSVLSFDESKNFKICIIDGGLSEEQIKLIEPKVYSIKKPKLNLKFNRISSKDKPHLLGVSCRLFLREYFPDFEKYIWIDSDAWVNSWSGIEHLLNGSKNGKLAVSTIVDRHTARVMRVNWLIKNIALVKSQNYKHANSSGYSTKISRKIGLKPTLNAGVFCLESKSKFWENWIKNFEFSIKKGKIFGSDQVALNVSVFHDGLEADILPHYCNWMPNTENTKYSLELKKFVEAFTPNHEIGIIHLAGGVWINGKDMRFDKNLKAQIKTIDEKNIDISFRFQN